MRSVIVVLALVFAASVAQAEEETAELRDGLRTVIEDTYYWWVTEDGVFGYTDDAKRIPARYQKACELPCRAAEALSFADLREKVAKRTTRLAEGQETKTATALETRLERLRATNAAVATPDEEEDCGTVTIRSERRDGLTNSGGTNMRVFIAENDCGVISVTPRYPEMQVQR